MTKNSILTLLYSSGAFSLFRLANRNRALILNYHRFSAERNSEATWVSAFAEQLEYLTAHYRIVPLATIAENPGRGEGLRSLAAITIDDGYRDAYDLAFPILRRYRVPATVFVITDFVGQRAWLWTDKMRYLLQRATSAHFQFSFNDQTLSFDLHTHAARLATARRINERLKLMSDEAKDEAIVRLAAQLRIALPPLPPPEYSALTWNEAREMAAHGTAIESHTVTHPILTATDDELLESELKQSRECIESELGRPSELFCYPNGDHDRRVCQAVKQAGYRGAVTTLSGLNDGRSDPLRLRRVHGSNDLAHFVQSVCGFEQLKQRFRPVRLKTAGNELYG